MTDFIYGQPVKIVFGKNKLEESIEKELSALSSKRPFLIVDPYFFENGLLTKLSSIPFVGNYHEISPNPKTTEVENAARSIKSEKADCVIAIGGGSTMDLAKVAACLATETDRIDEFFFGRKAFSKKLPTILCPTTSGTGSEVTKVAVLSSENKKAPLGTDLFFAETAIIDSTLTYSMPQKSIVICALDALCHAIEGYYSKYHQPICDAMAMYAAKLILDNIEKAAEKDEEALDKLSLASNIAGLAFAIPKTAAPHGISYALTTDLHMPHGEACAFTADKMLLINKDVENGRLSELSRYCGLSSVEELSERIFSIKKKYGLKCSLSDAGINVQDIPKFVKAAQNANTANNPVEMTEERLTELFLSLNF